MRAQAVGPPRSIRPAVVARAGARCRRLPRQELAVALRDPHLRGADPRLHAAVLAADRASGRGQRRPAGTTRSSPRCRRSASPASSTVDMATYWSPFGNAVIFIGVNIGGVGVLTLASILGLVISRGSDCARSSSPRATPTRRASTSARSPSVRRCASARSAGCCVTVAISSAARHRGRRSRSRCCRACSPPGYDSARRALVQPLLLGDGLHEHRIHARIPAASVPFVDDYWFLTILMAGVFLGSLGFPVIFALARTWRHAAPLERAREAHDHHHGHPLRRRRRRVPARSSTTTRGPTASSMRGTRSSSRSSCRR